MHFYITFLFLLFTTLHVIGQTARMVSNCTYTLGEDRSLCANWDGSKVRTNQGDILDTLHVSIPEDANYRY